MKTRKRILAYLLTLTLVMTSLPTQLFAQTTNDLPLPISALGDTQTTTPGAIQINPAKYVGDGYEVAFKVTNQWPGAFNGELVLTNTSNKPLENWTLKFDFEHEITNMWNAQIITHENSHYVIKNMGWNQDIEPGSSITIGFQANGEGTINNPSKYSVDMEKQVASDVDYTIGYKLTGYWNGGFNAEISITNQSKATIEDWSLAFDFDATINNMWTATIDEHKGNHYVIKNKGYNANIAPGQTLTLGFSGDSLKDSTIEPSHYELSYIGSAKNKEEIDYELDSDKDDLPDYYENILGTDPLNPDTDSDGIPDGYEYWELMTDPLLPDSDGNHISDADEDFDKDSLTNLQEFSLGTNPYNNDTDEDGIMDGDEVNKFGTNPLVYDEIDETLDTDQDGLADDLEMRLGTKINNPDSDSDGLLDGYEVFTLGTDPLEVDSDNNGINDGDEDFDKDGLTNLVEQKLGTDPQVTDTDKDDLSDGDEVNKYHTDPLLYDTDGDTIGDGDEIKIGLNPLKVATNGVPDNEYTFEQEVSEEALQYVNVEENDYKVHIEVEATGNAADNIIVATSQYTNTISSNDSVVGKVINIDYYAGEIEKGTLYFELEPEIVNQANLTNEESLQGLSRYYVFNYNEDNGILMPVATTYDSSANTLVADMNGVGTYCVMDLQKWYLGIDIIKDTDAANSQTRSLEVRQDSNVPSISPTNESTINTLQLDEAAVDSIITDKTNKKIDLVFVVGTGYTIEKKLVHLKNNMKYIVDSLIDEYGLDVEVCVIDYKDIRYTSGMIERENPLEAVQINGFQASTVERDRGFCFYKNRDDINYVIDTLEASEGNDINSTPLAGLGYVTTLPFRENAQKFTFLLTDQSYSVNNFHGFKTIYELLDNFNENDIHFSVSYIIDTMVTKRYKAWVEYCNGVYVKMTNLGIIPNEYVKYVLSNLQTEKEFEALGCKDLKPIILEAPLIYGGLTDTDKDGLSDSKEVNWKLVDISEEGYVLPTLGEIWKSVDLRYEDKVKNLPFSEELKDKKVLPLKSDPMLADSDEDGLLDPNDEWPLKNDFKELWYKMTINEKEFYIGHTGYGINSAQAHVYDHSNDSWQHYGLIDGLWLVSDKAKQIKREVDDIKDLVGFEEEEIAFEHPDEDVVIDLDEVLGTCRGVIEGYDSFIEDIKAENRDELDTVLGIFNGFIDCYFDESPEIINAKSTGKVNLETVDKKKALFKMMTPDLDEVKSLVLFLLDENEQELEQSEVYLEVKVTTDKVCVFGFSVIGGASAIVGAAQLAKGTGEVAGGVASAPGTGGASIVIAAKGGVSLKKAVEKIDLARKYIKKAENAFKQYCIDDKKYDELNGGRYTVGYSVTPKYSTYGDRLKCIPSEESTVGFWTRERGESVFVPLDNNLKEVLSKKGLEGIEYQDAMPDFSPFAVGEVQIDGMTNDRNKNNFPKADTALAKIWTEQLKEGKAWTKEEVGRWRTSNKYTWHELSDMETMQLVPSCINHPVFKHLGGCGEYNISQR